MIRILKNAASIITVDTNGKNYKRGKELNEVGILHDHSIVIEDDTIKDIIPSSSSERFSSSEQIDVNR
jgi:hypothetical protein